MLELATWRYHGRYGGITRPKDGLGVPLRFEAAARVEQSLGGRTGKPRRVFGQPAHFGGLPVPVPHRVEAPRVRKGEGREMSWKDGSAEDHIFSNAEVRAGVRSVPKTSNLRPSMFGRVRSRVPRRQLRSYVRRLYDALEGALRRPA